MISTKNLIKNIENNYIGMDASIMNCLCFGYVFINKNEEDNSIYCGIPQHKDGLLGFYVLNICLNDIVEIILEKINNEPNLFKILGDLEEVLTALKIDIENYEKDKNNRNLLLNLADVFNSILGPNYCGLDVDYADNERDVLSYLYVKK